MLDPDFETNLVRLQSATVDNLKAMGKAKREGDESAYHRAGLQLLENERAARAELRTEALRYAKELKIDPTSDDDAKSAQLVRAFARGCRLTRLWDDVMGEIPPGTRHAKKIYKIILPALDDLGRRGDLAKLFDNPDPSVRARAASLLKETMPHPCTSILKDVYRTQRFGDAGWISMSALPDDALERIRADQAKVAAQRRRKSTADPA